MKLHAVPMDLKEANEIVENYHRHSDPVRGHKFAVGCSDGEELAGVAILGRPVAQGLQDGVTAEILRCCVLPGFQRDGAKGSIPRPGAPGDAVARSVASFLYVRLWRAWRELGGRRLITYTLQTEGGESLRGAGFRVVAEVKPAGEAGWSRDGRERDWQPIYGQPKFRWEISAEAAA